MDITKGFVGSVQMSLAIIFFTFFSACNLLPNQSGNEGIGGAQPSPAFLPPEEFSDPDLVGKWGVLFGTHDEETLLLNNDGTFTQTFLSSVDPSLFYTGGGTWRVERHPSGCVYVHLEGMRYYHNTVSTAENGNRISPDGKLYEFIDPCLNRTITMPDKVILLVVNEPKALHNTALLFPRAGVESTDIALHLVTQ